MIDDSSKDKLTLETEVLKTYATLDYRADKWGPERIVFDAISNHFPEDCGGTAYFIELVQDGASIPFRDYDPAKPVEKVCFWDDGKGYDYIYTVLHHSNKKDRETQTGKFGEGLKMISAAALRHNVDIEFASQDWLVRPEADKLKLERENREVEILCQEVTTGYEMMSGSYTLIRKPSPEIIKHICSFTERIIDFREDLAVREIKELHPKHKIFLPKKLFKGELFVKRIKYPLKKPLYLSYQINGKQADALLSPDRDHVIESQLGHLLKQIVLKFNHINRIKPLLSPSAPDCIEKNIEVSSSDKIDHPQLWRKAFHQLYGQKAVLEKYDKHNVNEDAGAQGYAVVKNIPYGLKTLLLSAGIKTAADILNYHPNYELVSPDKLPSEQRELYELRSQVDQIIFGHPLPADVNLFSRAYDEQGDVAWFKGMSYWNQKDKRPLIYISTDQLQNPKDFLATYAHEAVHVFTQSSDISKEFEEGLTKALGKVLEDYLTKLKP